MKKSNLRVLILLFAFVTALAPFETPAKLFAEHPAAPFSNSLVEHGYSDRSLKEAAKGLFKIGVGTSWNAISNVAERKLLREQFEILTPENCMKPAAIHNTGGVLDFRNSDRLVDLAVREQIDVVGHCLVWAKDDRTPAWFFKDGEQPASRELLLQRMQRHIETVVGRYGGTIDQWDVVNEALDDGAPLYRPSGWQTAFGGPEFIVKAFEFARAADPSALLIYNDYRSELPGKREKLFKLLKYLKNNDAPVDAVGLQGHYELDNVPFEDLEYTMGEIRKMGLKIVISEVDIDAVKRGKWWAENGKFRDELKSFDPYKDGLPPEVAKRQAEQYAQLFRLYAKNADIIERVTFWNLHDGRSWLNYFPWKRVNHTLLFDRNLKPKAAFDAVYEVLRSAERPNKE